MHHLFHWLEWYQRLGIMGLLILNCVFQFLNQVFRVQYWSYDAAQDEVALVNVFFALSFLAAAVAGGWMYVAQRRVAHQHKAKVLQRVFSQVQLSMRHESLVYRQMHMMMPMTTLDGGRSTAEIYGYEGTGGSSAR
jgi:hypothetical protein